MAIKVVVADDHALVRQSLRRYLEMEQDIAVVGEAGMAEEVLDLVDLEQAHLDVVILDARLPERGGVETARAIHEAHDEVAVVLLSDHDDPGLVADALRAGAQAYVPKTKDAEHLVETVRLVAEGRIVIDPEYASALQEWLGPSSASSQRAILTPRETQVLQLLSFGNTNKEVAERLGISSETVKAHLHKIFQKLEVSDRAAAMTAALR